MTALLVASEEKRKCRVCGCMDDDCSSCIEKTGRPCTWVDRGLCSACAPARAVTLAIVGDKGAFSRGLNG